MNRIKLHDKTFKECITEVDIAKRVGLAASLIVGTYSTRRPLFVVVLDGACWFATDILRQMDILCDVKFMKVSSYAGTESTGKVKEVIGLNKADVKDRAIILLEDIVDTGLTIKVVREKLSAMGAESVEVVALLFKGARNKYKEGLVHSCFYIEDDFVVGYGLDYNGLGRNLPSIYDEDR